MSTSNRNNYQTAAQFMNMPVAVTGPTSSSSQIKLPNIVVAKGFPHNVSIDTIDAMNVWNNSYLRAKIMEGTDSSGRKSIKMQYETHEGAMDAIDMINGKQYSPGGSYITAEFAGYGVPPVTNGRAAATPRTATALKALDRITANANAELKAKANAPPSTNHHGNGADLGGYSHMFGPQSPIGNERTRATGKSLINNESADDETTELLRDPIGAARRSTVPDLSSRMANLNVNTANGGGTMSYPNTAMLPPASNALVPQGYYRQGYPPVNPADQNPPCNTLYVGNLPADTSEDELKALFSKQRGYKRLCFRTKGNGPMCFVEFEDISLATKTLHELYGYPLHNSVKGGIRLSFSKNPLGVRADRPVGIGGPFAGGSSMMVPHGMMHAGGSFTTASGPPPGLSAPPGFGHRGSFGGNGMMGIDAQYGYGGGNMYGSQLVMAPSYAGNSQGGHLTLMAAHAYPGSSSDAYDARGANSNFPPFMLGR